MAKISIVTPAFNSIRYIQNCIESVRYVCKGLSYEHIIVDGGSTDGTREYVAAQSDVTLIAEPDTGMYDALNKGVARASGVIIGHLNSDEQYNRKGFLQAIAQLDENDALDAVFSSTIMLRADLSFLYHFKQVVVPRVVDTHWRMPVQSVSLLYRKHCWERIQYDTSYRLVADHVWFRKQMESGMRIAYCKEPIGIFVWHDDCLSNKHRDTSNENAIADVDRSSWSIRLAKHIYHFRKWLAGGYTRSPVSYELWDHASLKTCAVDKPRIRVGYRDLR